MSVVPSPAPAPPLVLHLRGYQPGDAPALRALFHAAVHQLTGRDYGAAQQQAWAPAEHDGPAWAARMQALQPWVAEVVVAAEDGLAMQAPTQCIAGYADLQEDGCIDHFFVAPACAGRGVARALMAQLHSDAARRGLPQLWANVSLTAEPFFARAGFAVTQRQQVERAGMVLRNARMVKRLAVGVSAI